MLGNPPSANEEIEFIRWEIFIFSLSLSRALSRIYWMVFFYCSYTLVLVLVHTLNLNLLKWVVFFFSLSCSHTLSLLILHTYSKFIRWDFVSCTQIFSIKFINWVGFFSLSLILIHLLQIYLMGFGARAKHSLKFIE